MSRVVGSTAFCVTACVWSVTPHERAVLVQINLSYYLRALADRIPCPDCAFAWASLQFVDAHTHEVAFFAWSRTMARRGGGGKAEERRSKAHATRAALSDRSASDLSSDAGPAVSDESSGSDSNEQRSRWRDELFVALKRGHTPHVRRLLLAHGYPVNDPLFATGSAESGITVRGAATALHVAAWAGQAPMCRWLLRHGADPHARDGLHMTPAETATSAEVLRVLSRARKYRQQF